MSCGTFVNYKIKVYHLGSCKNPKSFVSWKGIQDEYIRVNIFTHWFSFWKMKYISEFVIFFFRFLDGNCPFQSVFRFTHKLCYVILVIFFTVLLYLWLYPDCHCWYHESVSSHGFAICFTIFLHFSLYRTIFFHCWLTLLCAFFITFLLLYLLLSMFLKKFVYLKGSDTCVCGGERD